MRTIFILCILSNALLAGQDVKVEEVGNSPVEAKFAPGGQVRIDICPAGVDLIGRDDSMVRVSYTPERDSVRVRIRVSGNRAELGLTGCPHNNFKVKIELPKSSALYVRMMAGQLDVRDIKGDKDLELSFGQLNVDVGNVEDYGHEDASVNSGEIAASAFGVQKGGLFRSFDRNGPGRCRLHAHVGAGQVELR
jgi:hypothetical protein